MTRDEDSAGFSLSECGAAAPEASPKTRKATSGWMMPWASCVVLSAAAGRAAVARQRDLRRGLRQQRMQSTVKDTADINTNASAIQKYHAGWRYARIPPYAALFTKLAPRVGGPLAPGEPAPSYLSLGGTEPFRQILRALSWKGRCVCKLC